MSVTISPKAPYHSIYFGAPDSAPRKTSDLTIAPTPQPHAAAASAADIIAGMAAIVCGVGVVIVLQVATGGLGVAGVTPALAGLIAAVAGFSLLYFSGAGRHVSQPV